MLEKITIQRIASFTKKPDGTPLINRNNKPYVRVLIDTTDGRKMSGFGNHTTSQWKEGDEVEVEIKESNGYLNFEVPKKENVSEMAIKTHIDQKFAALQADLKVIADHLGVEAPKPKVGNTGVDYPENEYGEDNLNPEDIPF